MSMSGVILTIDDVPQQNAADQASLAGRTMSKKKRCSSGQNFVAPRLIWMGSGLTKCWGVCTTPIVESGKNDMARLKNCGVGTKSASRIETNSGGSGNLAICFRAWLMFPALACALSDRER